MASDIPFAATPPDRAAHHRTDAKWLDAAFAREDVLILLMQGGEPLLTGSGDALLWLGAQASALTDDAIRLFLGEDKNGVPIFALGLPEAFKLDASPIAGLGEFTDMRSAAVRLSALEVGLAATARSLFEWHRRHGFCANCGADTRITEAGWKRECVACEAEHFPRTDPVAIMLAVKGDKCLMGRGPLWPEGFFSCLAGFVEPGETVEQAAARELFEEAGIKADASTAEYLFCQPWPFPSSLMIGLIIEAETTEITLDEAEVAEARWFTRAEARDILAGKHSDVFCPPKFAIAHHILKTWAERD